MWLRTPYGRSLRFASLEDALSFHDHNAAAVAPVLVVGALLAVARLVLPDAAFVPVLVLGLGAGLVVAVVLGTRARRAQPSYHRLTWSESVALDARPVRIRDAMRDLGAGLASLALLGFAVFLFQDDPRTFLRADPFEQIVIVVVLFGLGLATAIGTYLCV